MKTPQHARLSCYLPHGVRYRRHQFMLSCVWCRRLRLLCGRGKQQATVVNTEGSAVLIYGVNYLDTLQ